MIVIKGVLFVGDYLILRTLSGADPGIPKRGAQSEIYMHSYSKYFMPIGSFLEGFLNLAWSHK